MPVGTRMLDRLDRLFAERNVERLRLVRVRQDEGGECANPLIPVAAAPDRLHIGRDFDELGDVVAERAVVIGGEQQTGGFWSARRVTENREPREVNRPAAGEINVRPGLAAGCVLALDIVADCPENMPERPLLTPPNGGEDGQTTCHAETLSLTQN